MIGFVHKLDLNDKKDRTNGTVRYKHYKGKLLFPIKAFVSFGKDHQSPYFMSTRLLKYSIDGVCVPQFQLGYITDTTHPLHKYLIKLCHYVHYMWWGDQDLELQYW